MTLHVKTQGANSEIYWGDFGRRPVCEYIPATIGTGPRSRSPPPLTTSPLPHRTYALRAAFGSQLIYAANMLASL